MQKYNINNIDYAKNKIHLVFSNKKNHIRITFI